jgi:hypothetical protein
MRGDSRNRHIERILDTEEVTARRRPIHLIAPAHPTDEVLDHIPLARPVSARQSRGGSAAPAGRDGDVDEAAETVDIGEVCFQIVVGSVPIGLDRAGFAVEAQKVERRLAYRGEGHMEPDDPARDGPEERRLVRRSAVGTVGPLPGPEGDRFDHRIT